MHDLLHSSILKYHTPFLDIAFNPLSPSATRACGSSLKARKEYYNICSTNYYFMPIYLNFSCARNDCVLSLCPPQHDPPLLPFFLPSSSLIVPVLSFPFSALDLALLVVGFLFIFLKKKNLFSNLGFEFRSSLSHLYPLFFLYIFPLSLK